MGRRAEVEMMARVSELLAEAGVREVYASFVRTAKNGPAVGLFDWLGFALVGASGEGVGACARYRADVRDLPRRTGLFEDLDEELVR